MSSPEIVPGTKEEVFPAPSKDLARRVSAALDLLMTGTKPEFYEVIVEKSWTISKWKSPTSDLSFAYRKRLTDKLVCLFSGTSVGDVKWLTGWDKLKPLLPDIPNRDELIQDLAKLSVEISAKKNEPRRARATKILSETAEAASISAPTNADIWELTSESFARSPNFSERAREYLRGEVPSPDTALHAAVWRSDADVIAQLAEKSQVIVVDAPLGEGTSTVLLQAAFRLIGAGRRVFWLRPDELESFPKSVPWNERPVVFVDRAEDLQARPSWLNEVFPGTPTGCLVVGVANRSSERVAEIFRNLRPDAHRLSPVKVNEAGRFVEKIIEFDAGQPGMSGERVEELFQNGLTSRQASSGLWPAQYQATRGELLDVKVRTLIRGLDDPEKIALSAVVFLDFIRNLELRDVGSNRLPSPELQFLRAFIRCQVPDAEIRPRVEDALSNLPRTMIGEIRRRGGALDHLIDHRFVVEFRHEALTDSIFRWCFGAADSTKGDELFNKWNYYHWLIEATAQQTIDGEGNPALTILLRMERNLKYDVLRKPLRRRLETLEYPKIGDSIVKAVETARAKYGSVLGDHGYVSRRIDLIHARALSHGNRDIDDKDRRQARERITNALATAIPERDVSVIRQAAKCLSKIGGTIEIAVDGCDRAVDWRGLFEVTVKIANSTEKRDTYSSWLQAELGIREHVDATQLATLAAGACLLSPGYWDESRLTTLKRILDRVRKKFPKNVEYLLPFASFEAGGLSSIQAIYREFGRELHRISKRNSNPALSSRGAGQLDGLIQSVLDCWTYDIKRNADCSWPGDIEDLVPKACNDRSELKHLLRAFDGI